MTKQKLWIALIVAIICQMAAIDSLAERTAPTFAEHLTNTVEAGKSYYLYNVEAGRFWARSTSSSTSSQSVIDKYGKKILVTSTAEGTYHLQFADNNYYIYSSSSSASKLYSMSAASDKYDDFAIAATDDAITIQRASTNPYYSETEFIGWKGTEDDLYLYCNLTVEAIEWKLLPEEIGDRYFAKLQLYEALELTNGYPYDLTKYEEIYADESSTNEELIAAASRLNTGFKFSNTVGTPEWSDYPIFFETDDISDISYSSLSFYKSNNNIDEICVTATFTVDKECTFVYDTHNSKQYGTYHAIEINGKKQRYQSPDYGYNRYFIELTPGKYNIKFYLYDYYDHRIENVGIEVTPSITVSLLEPGSLGTEVLYNVDHIKDVRKLKIIGEMNDDDWAKIDMMVNLFTLDLSEAKITEIKDKQFQSSYDITRSDVKFPFFHEIKLPEGLSRIGDYAFEYAQIEEIKFPSTLKKIGKYAFAYTRIKEAIMPDEMESIGNYAFSTIRYSLTNVNYPKNLDYIPEYCFYNCRNIKLDLHDNLKRINGSAFRDCYNYNPKIPTTIKYLGQYALSNTAIDSVAFDNVTVIDIDDYTFQNCRNLKYVDFPPAYSKVNSLHMFIYCYNLRKVIFRSASVVSHGDYAFFSGLKPDSITIVVPSHLINSYKLDEYWYNYKIEGFDTSEVQDWTINAPVVLNARDRFNGNPNIGITGGGTLKINGEKAQYINNLTTRTYYGSLSSSGQILSNCDSVSIAGKYRHQYYVNANKWYFLALPFNVKVSEITNSNGAEFAIRWYDGASRASVGTGLSWTNFESDDTIPAGKGFILQANADSWFYFDALDDEMKQTVALNEDFTYTLEENSSGTKANSGWNLVGNPYQCYYNIHKLNFTAPITLWDVSKKTYTAYSIIDDDVALEPNQAFFVQCPEGVSGISFPKAGRQLDAVITSQSAIIAKSSAATRLLFDLDITSSTAETDKTRVVINPAASDGYEVTTDASKFMSMDGSVPQVYTLDAEGNMYSINEGAVSSGIVKVGFYAPENGCYTFSLSRCGSNEVYLVDNNTSSVTNLSTDSYEFVADAGIDNDRFELRFSGDLVTGINGVLEAVNITGIAGGIRVDGIHGEVSLYSIDGCVLDCRTMNGETHEWQLEPGTYLVSANGNTFKVLVNR